NPGAYALVSKSERLADVLRRAGGLTASANPDGIVLLRARVGRVGVELREVLRNPDSPENVPLVDGDSIYVPPATSVVTVRGAVNAPFAVAYVPGASIDYYVRSAGGATIKGDFGRSYVTQPSGRLETRHRRLVFWTSQPQPKPGSIVYVPDKDPNDKTDW